jgi:hypothetical protein
LPPMRTIKGVVILHLFNEFVGSITRIIYGINTV